MPTTPRNRPTKCQATPGNADAKRRSDEEGAQGFIGRLGGYKTTGEEDIVMLFFKDHLGYVSRFLKEAR
jgi:hypothetical protein